MTGVRGPTSSPRRSLLLRRTAGSTPPGHENTTWKLQIQIRSTRWLRVLARMGASSIAVYGVELLVRPSIALCSFLRSSSPSPLGEAVERPQHHSGQHCSDYPGRGGRPISPYYHLLLLLAPFSHGHCRRLAVSFRLSLTQ